MHFSPGASKRVINPDTIDLDGEVCGRYKSAPVPF
jgi:hypothetical protein